MIGLVFLGAWGRLLSAGRANRTGIIVLPKSLVGLIGSGITASNALVVVTTVTLSGRQVAFTGQTGTQGGFRIACKDGEEL
jgi:hypothetical protein